MYYRSERGAAIFRIYMSERGVLMQKGRSTERCCKEMSERGVEENRGARSGDVKKGRSAEWRCQKGPERGAIFTPGRAPVSQLIALLLDK